MNKNKLYDVAELAWLCSCIALSIVLIHNLIIMLNGMTYTSTEFYIFWIVSTVGGIAIGKLAIMFVDYLRLRKLISISEEVTIR